MYGLSRIARWWLYIGHRWIGVGTCVLFVVWFASGLVMMYVPYPALSEPQRVAALPRISWNLVRLTPDDAMIAAGLKRFPRTLDLEMLDGRPVYRTIDWHGRHKTISAIDGSAISRIDAATALRVASDFAHHAPRRLLGLVWRDQWTVSAAHYDAFRPLYRIAVADAAGTVVYVSAATGEVVLAATRSALAWNWLGSVPHWIYFTALRAHQPLWRQVILWTAGFGILGAISGVWIGILRLRLNRRYPRGRASPYRGWQLWHHLIGLLGGLLIVTWIFSGWLSVKPNRWFEEQPLSAAAMRRYAAHAAATFDVPLATLHALSHTNALEVRFSWLDGRALLTLAEAHGNRQMIDAHSGESVRLSDADVFAAASRLLPDYAMTTRQRLTTGDSYWHSRPGSLRELPVLRVEFDDPQGTWFYVDPATGELLASLDASGRGYRWLFYALHDLDFRTLLAYWPAWDVMVWALSLLGLTVSISGVIIGWRRVRHKISRERRSGRRARSSAWPSA